MCHHDRRLDAEALVIDALHAESDAGVGALQVRQGRLLGSSDLKSPIRHADSDKSGLSLLDCKVCRRSSQLD
jgi:hypothetical protein